MNKIFSLTAILLIVGCLWMASCTMPKAPEPTGQNTESVATPEPVLSVETPELSAGETESVVTPEEEVTESVTKENPPEIMNLFKDNTTWPPESITDEQRAILNRAEVVLETTKGIIRIRVFPEAAPLHAANFVKLASEGYYDGIVFHRVIRGFMSQGGDPTGTGGGGPEYTIPAEIGLPHRDGAVAAARTGDQMNPQRRSSGSQFYMCHSTAGCAMLDGQYTVFGQIVQGQDVNLALTITYDDQGAIDGAVPDKIVRAWVELTP